MKKQPLPLRLGLAVVFAIATAFGTDDDPLDEPEHDGVVLGEVDLAERGAIIRNRFRRMTPVNAPLVQDIAHADIPTDEIFGIWYETINGEKEWYTSLAPVGLGNMVEPPLHE